MASGCPACCARMTLLRWWQRLRRRRRFPQLTGRVVDQADLLRPEQELDISSKSEALQAQTGRQFVVATVKSLEGVSDRGLCLSSRPGLEDRRREERRRCHPARRSERAQGLDRDRLWRGRVPDRCRLGRDRPRDDPSAVQEEPAGLWRRESRRARMRSSSRCRLPPDQAKANTEKAQQQAGGRKLGIGQLIPAIFDHDRDLLFHHRSSPAAGGRRYRARRGGISPWVVLWGLNELSRGSRGGGWGGGAAASVAVAAGGGGGGGFSGGGGSFGGGGAGGSW